MITDKRGLYVHIPFCLKKCDYCDFCSYVGVSTDLRRRYISALADEIKSYKRNERIVLDSIFFGGGTPTLLSEAELSLIVGAIKDSFILDKNLEFTFEANPKTLDSEKCRALKEHGVNRISIGLQSIHENELKGLGRIHTFSDFLHSYKLCREYFDNISVDLMYGIPEQTKESFEKTLKEILLLNPNHISVYGLILEEGTPLYTSHKYMKMPSEDEECDMYYLAARILGECGFSHYEISNYAKAGFESRHNLKYWQMDEYIGVGLTAASCFDSKRYVNTGDFEEYFECIKGKYPRNYESIDATYEYAMLGLRLKSGISLSEYREIFDVDFLLGREEKIQKFTDSKLIEISHGRLHLTESGFYVSNYILSELL